MNRYDTPSVAKFNPLTLNEILLAPTVMREKHDKSIAAAEALRIKANPLDKHLNRTLELKNQMDSEISKNVDELNSKGYNSVTFQNIVKLNRQYQDTIAPTGEIGQINNAKIVYDTEKANFLKSAEAQKIGSDRALELWNNKTSNYTGFGEDGKTITNVTPQGVAAFQDYGQQLSRANSILGETINGFPIGGGYHLEKAPDGGTVFVDKQGSRVTGNNARQVESAYNSFRDSWINGEGAAYARDAGLGIDEERIRNDFNSMLKYSDIRKEDINRSYSKPDIVESDPTGMIISNDSTLKSDALNNASYQNVIKDINLLQNKKGMSSSERSKLEDLKELKSISDKKIASDAEYKKIYPEYSKEINEWKSLSKKFNLSETERNLIEKNPNLIPQILFSKGAGSFTGKKDDKDLLLIMDDKKLSKFNSLMKKKEVIQDKYWKESSSLRHNYSYMPSTPKEESAWNLHNENVFNVMKSTNLGNILDLTSINTTGGTRKDLNHEDVKNIQNLLNNGDSKSFKINNVKTYGDNRTPEITMTFNTLEGAPEYDAKGVSWNDEYGGSGKPVTVTFKLKKFSNSFDTGSAAGYKNLTGAIANFWKDKGGMNEITGNFQGAEVYNSMVENSYSEISNEELYQRAQVDPDAREALMIRVAKSKKQ